MNALQWAGLAVRLGALALYASLPVWIGSTLGAASVAAYQVFQEDADLTSAIIAIGNYAAPAVVTWLLARYLWRHAEALIVLVPSDDDPEDHVDEGRHGEELLAAGLVIYGAFSLVTRAWTPLGVWYMHHHQWLIYGLPASYEEFANPGADCWAAASVFDIVTALLLIFSGRRIAARVFHRDGFSAAVRSPAATRD